MKRKNIFIIKCTMGLPCGLGLFAFLVLLLQPVHGKTEQLVAFDFAANLGTTQRLAQITSATPVGALLSTATRDIVAEAARAKSWQMTGNYFRFSFVIDPAWVADLTSLKFDYLSEKNG